LEIDHSNNIFVEYKNQYSLFSFFKKKSGGNKKLPRLADLNDNPLKEGDIVLSHRYELGECKIIKTENGIEYESISSGKRVSWLRMIDAATEKQKVNKVEKD
jgi:hypothetical protein